MQLLLLRIWILVLTFCFGISVSALWRIYTFPLLPMPVVKLTPSPAQPIGFPHETEALHIVDGQHNCGSTPAPETYKLSDGGRITVFCKPFKTRAKADEELDRRLGKVNVLERTISIDRNGNQGEEIIITSPLVVRLWKSGRVLCVTEATSLEHLRWFQKLDSP